MYIQIKKVQTKEPVPKFSVKLIPNSCPIKIPILRRFKGELSNKFFHFQTQELHELENENSAVLFIPLNLKINFR